MKVLIIYASECQKEVEALRTNISTKFGRQTILRMNSRERNTSKSHIKHAWHHDAIKMMKLADVVVYAVSEHSNQNSNVEWELKKALSLGKYLVCLRVTKDAKLNDCLFSYDKNTKEKYCVADIINSEDDLFAIIESYNNNEYIHLINKNYDVNVLLEQYKIFSDSAESLVTRRQNMNSFYISANTALITIGATIFALCDEKNLFSKLIIVLALSVPGFLLNISWIKMLKSYFINNRGKMKVLSMMEKHLSASLYDAEWKAMKNRFSKEKYVSFTESEKKLPLVFIIFYFIAAIVALAVLCAIMI